MSSIAEIIVKALNNLHNNSSAVDQINHNYTQRQIEVVEDELSKWKKEVVDE